MLCGKAELQSSQKLRQAVAAQQKRRIWIVRLAWLQACQAAQARVSEADHEVVASTAVSKPAAPKRTYPRPEQVRRNISSESCSLPL